MDFNHKMGFCSNFFVLFVNYHEFFMEGFPHIRISSNIFDLSSTDLDFLSVVFPQFGFSANMSDVFHN